MFTSFQNDYGCLRTIRILFLLIVFQSVTPSLPDAVKSSLVASIESDVFGGSSRMAIEDIALALSDAVVIAIPGTYFEVVYLVDMMVMRCMDCLCDEHGIWVQSKADD